MKKEITICLIVIAIVIIGNIATQSYTKKCIEIINSELENLKQEIIEVNEKKISDKIDEIEKKWDNMQELLAFYIEHDELEKIETQICLLKGQIEAKTYEDTFQEIEKCIFILEHIVDKTSLNIKNIF